MNFSYNWLQSFFKKKLPNPEKLAEALTMKAFEVEEIKKVKHDWVLDIDILSNRGSDCFSHLGIAREIAAILNLELQIPPSQLEEEKDIKAADFVSVTVKDKKGCLRYSARVVTEVSVFPSPKWLREYLKACGLKPINNIVDIANFVMLETGQPLHAFDLDKISDRKIIVRKAKRGERIITLDDERYGLQRSVLVIADTKQPLAIAGIKGGRRAEIDRKTKTIVLESANFHPKVIRQGSKSIDLKTDASWRFEHGIDPTLTELAINRTAYLIKEIAKGKIAKGIIDFYPKKVTARKIKLDLNYVEDLLGIKINKREIMHILKKLGFKYKQRKFPNIEVEIPTFRLDVSIPEDLIEEIGRIYGYQNIPSVFPMSALIPPERNLEVFWENMAKNILKESGFREAYNHSFLGKREVDIFHLKNLIEIENPVSASYQYLRPSLIPNLLKNIQKNEKSFKDINVFELGKIFREEKIKEKRMLTGLMTGDSFYQLKGVIDLLFGGLGMSGLWYDQYEPTPEESKRSWWHPRKCAEIKINNKEIGFLGEISFKITKELKINSRVVAFDLDFEKLQQLASEEQEFRPISPYPAAIRDIAVLVPRDILVEEVLNKIEIAGGKLVRDIDLFDIYEGDEISEGKKNLAFHIIYQSEDRTLSSEEIDKIQDKIMKALEEKKDWQVRK
jgi:phenylalanyl-tRNA synthetase beta chain